MRGNIGLEYCTWAFRTDLVGGGILDLDAYREEVRLHLTGGVLELELDDTTLDRVINSAFREVQRYIASVNIITVPYSPCIDVSSYKISAVTNIFRAESYYSLGSQSDIDGYTPVDPMQAAFWQLAGGTGNINNFNNYVYNFASWNTLLQIRNTISTDLSFYYDKLNDKLYINCATDTPSSITIEYIPRFDDVSEIVSDYWIDVLVRLSVALAKVTVGRVRSRYTQTNALWAQDGEALLAEGNTELNELRSYLQQNNQLIYPID